MPNAALSQKLKPSPKLAEILGSSQPLSRADAVKELWDYFKKHNLQDPKNRREIRADANLRPLFGKDRITMFEVGRIVNSNLEGGSSSKNHQRKQPNGPLWSTHLLCVQPAWLHLTSVTGNTVQAAAMIPEVPREEPMKPIPILVTTLALVPTQSAWTGGDARPPQNPSPHNPVSTQSPFPSESSQINRPSLP